MELFIAYFYPWLQRVAVIIPLLPFGVGLWLIRKQKDTKFKLLFLYVSFGVVAQAAQLISFMLGTKNNLWMNHAYTLLEFSIMASILYYCFNRPLLKRAIIFGVIVLSALIYYDAFITDGLMRMNSMSRVAANVMLIILAITYFYKVANNPKIVYLDRDPIFLLCCSILIYYAGTSMSYAIFNEALAISNDAAYICVAINMLLVILFYMSHTLILKKMAA